MTGTVCEIEKTLQISLKNHCMETRYGERKGEEMEDPKMFG